MFEKHPEGVRIAGRFLAAEIGGNVGDDGVESGVSVAALEEFEKVLAQGLVVVGHEASISIVAGGRWG